MKNNSNKYTLPESARKPYTIQVTDNWSVTVQAKTEFEARETVFQWVAGNEEYKCQ